MSDSNWIFSRLTSTYREGGDNTFLNPYSYTIMRKYKEMDFEILADGSVFVLFCNMFLGLKLKRRSFDGTSLAPVVFRDASDKGKKVYFVGSKKQEIESAISEIKKQYPVLNVLRYRDGYFTDKERSDELDLLIKDKPDIVIVGMGTPLQEFFLRDLRELGWQGTGFTCGGFLHQSSNGIDYYPKLIDKLNLRWLYRIYDEPKLFKRYTVDYSKFVFLFTYDVVNYFFRK